MPQISPVILQYGDPAETATLNPVGYDGQKTTFVDAAKVAIALQQRLTVRVRPAAPTNGGHLVESVLTQPIDVAVPSGCCPSEGAPPVNSFNLRFTRNVASSDEDAEKLLDELISYVQTDDFKALVLGGGYY